MICSGRVEPSLIIESFGANVDGVMIIGCFFEDSHFNCNRKVVESRARETKDLMHILGLNKKKLLVILQTLEDDMIPRTLENFSRELSAIKNLSVVEDDERYC